MTGRNGRPTAPAAVGDGLRLRAVRDTGLSAHPDAGMDRFARLVKEVLEVPAALVALVTADRQILPGLAGSHAPWARERSLAAPLALCGGVVDGGDPVVVERARAAAPGTDATPGGAGSGGHAAADPVALAPEVQAYAGVALTDRSGRVLGALCALDNRPRAWSGRELALLTELAAACGAELRLRIAARRREEVHRDEAAARTRADGLARRSENALARSELLLRAADALADTTGLAEVDRQVHDLVTLVLRPVHVRVMVDDGGVLRRLTPEPAGTGGSRVPLGERHPAALAARENRIVTVSGGGEMATGYGRRVAAEHRALGLETVVCVPLPGRAGPLGVLVMGWDRPYEVDDPERAVLAALAGYTARAVERALFVENRVDVARQMQEAMLTDLPSVSGLQAAAHYRPAADIDMVGGDWYDLYRLPSAAQGGEDAEGAATVAATIGDITGHDMRAATLMGQVRSMLRQADLDHPGTGPAHVVSAFEHANRALGLGCSGTLVHAHLRLCPPPDGSSWELSWTNAGHPPPLVVLPDGRVEQLVDHGALMHPGVAVRRRDAHRHVLPPGALLLLYTDGLVEHRGGDLDVAIARTGSFLATRREAPLPELLTELVDAIAGTAADDDIALLALRVPADGS
ncbi:PP2C family protein-serine/threonine phosphatase [Streptomyces bohaiensis]|uniref:PP2C family protein-serine/threonine phosphatase n=1 Tax=Streptomyces bohaiensis TaxID=1431344 RepID=UPI003B75F9AC